MTTERTEHIEDEIERTRDEMASTLNAIERKLSPKQIMDQAVDTMRDLASDQSRVAQVVRDNPIPLALIGLGIGWLAVSSSMGRKSSPAEDSYESMEGLAPAWSSTGLESQTYGSAEYTGGAEGRDMRERASQLVGSTRETMSRAAESTRGRVSQWSQQARSSANQAAGRTREVYQDHPLTMGVVAALVGAAFGAILPRSRAESETLGQAGGDLLRQARQAGSELVDKAGRVTERAVQAAKEEGERAYRQEAGSSGTTSSMTH